MSPVAIAAPRNLETGHLVIVHAMGRWYQGQIIRFNRNDRAVVQYTSGAGVTRTKTVGRASLIPATDATWAWVRTEIRGCARSAGELVAERYWKSGGVTKLAMVHNRRTGEVEVFDDPIAVCSLCGAQAVVKLPPSLLRAQPDDTTHVCHPIHGGCNQGFTLDP